MVTNLVKSSIVPASSRFSFFLRHYICVMLQLRMGPAIVLLVIKVAVNTRDSGNGIAGTVHNVSKGMKLFKY